MIHTRCPYCRMCMGPGDLGCGELCMMCGGSLKEPESTKLTENITPK